MSWATPDFVTAKDVGLAYRKAKADIFYERGHPNAFDLCAYEEHLEKNLRALLDRLTSADLGWMSTVAFVGSWLVIPKGIKNVREFHRRAGLQHSNPDDAWRASVLAMQSPRRPEKPTAEFRLIGVHSIDFHVVSALWMLKVGYLYDGVLGSEAYGSRLRRRRPRKPEEGPREVNLYSLGSFEPYFSPFGKWRDNGLRAMREALDAKRRVVAITADVRQFYHRTSPDFLLHGDYLKAVGLDGKLSADQCRFTEALIGAFHTWAGTTPVHRGKPDVGLPVGLPAARLIANVALAELDSVIVRELTPLYYGRYVDDTLLVFENKRNFENGLQVWKYICARTAGILKLRKGGRTPAVQVIRKYLGRSKIEFVGEKQKVFLLEGPTGKTLVKSIERQVRSRASEWRALPDRPDSPDALAADLVTACGENGEQVDNLRKTESLSLRRAALAIRLRDMEAFEQDLSADSWKTQRSAFLETIRHHLLALPRFFDFAVYLPRIFALAIACMDYEQAMQLLSRLSALVRYIEADCLVLLAAEDGSAQEKEDTLDAWRRHLVRSLSQALAAALAPDQAKDQAELAKVLQGIECLAPAGKALFRSTDTALSWARRLSTHDMGRVGYRMRYFPYRSDRLWGFEADAAETLFLSEDSPFIERRIHDGVASFLAQLTEEDKRVPLALLFPTRPFDVDELYFLAPRILDGSAQPDIIGRWTLAFRGFIPEGQVPGAPGPEKPIMIPWTDSGGKRKLAVTSWETSEDSWKASIVSQPDPDRTRYERLNRLMNAVLGCGTPLDYVVLPELSLPSRWFFRLASKLKQRRISLIAGIEYLHHDSGRVANQVWASLVSDFLGFPSLVVYRQDKKRAAPHEESSLWQIGGKQLSPIGTCGKPTLRHGTFHFGILVCSELANVSWREGFRGKVDAIFVPEWNQDTETFSYLVEASALDIHAYIIQCNNRRHGDSRIRAPTRDSWRRDIVRVKGGVEDYFVVGEIDILALRQFQSAHRSPPDGYFKPVPDGFEIDQARRHLP